MERAELESRLRQLLSEAPRVSPGPVPESDPEPFSDGFAVESSMTERVTAEVVAANHRAGDAPGSWRHLPLLLPELAESTPVQMLEALTARFRESPDHRNADLLQTAINRVTASEFQRDKHRKVIAQAKDLLHTGEGLADPAVADDIWYDAYRDPDFGGPYYFTSMTPGWAYWRQPDFGQLRAVYANVRMNDLISSIDFGSSPTEAGGQVILFEHFRYEGRFVNFSVPPGGERRVPFIGSDFNDLATSALIIRRWPNETLPVPVASVIPAGALTQAFSSVPNARLNGNPVVTWDMWPIGPDGDGRWHPTEPERAFIHLIVHLRINLPNPMPGLWAVLKFWIYPFVMNGVLFATVTHWAYEFEGIPNIVKWLDPEMAAMAHALMELSMKQAGPRAVGRINNMIETGTNRLNQGGPFRFCYLMPGNPGERGNVHDGVQLVAVR